MSEDEEMQDLEVKMKEVAAAMNTMDVAWTLASLVRIDLGHI